MAGGTQNYQKLKAYEKIGMKGGAAWAAPAALLQTAVLVAVLVSMHYM